MRHDSDEEAGAACSSAGAPPLRQRGATLSRAAAALRGLQRELAAFRADVPPVVSFCVDGRLFSVRRDVLLRDPQSVLFLLAERHYAGAAGGAIAVPCRDPVLFAMLLNLLRGYRHAVPDAHRDACGREARFYGLERSWRARYPAAAAGRFRPLMGGDRLFADVVCAAASPFLAAGLHTMCFRVERCEMVALGVVEDGAEMDAVDAVGRCRGMALYWNDGRVAHNFGELVTEKTGCSFAAKMDVRVELDCEDAMARWVLPGEQCVSVVRLPPQRRFAFAVAAARSSEVRICPDEAD